MRQILLFINCALNVSFFVKNRFMMLFCKVLCALGRELSIKVNFSCNNTVKFLLVSLSVVSRGQKFWLDAGGVRIHLPSARPQTISDQTRCIPLSFPGNNFQTLARILHQFLFLTNNMEQCFSELATDFVYTAHLHEDVQSWWQ